jgi:2-polyprenyl-6-methoxyphenol hydroxylase-like FAD-dependent oxidoreductase
VDTRFPFILFVSQAETEAVLNDYLHASSVRIERGQELISFEREGDGLRCLLQRPDGGQERVYTRFSDRVRRRAQRRQKARAGLPSKAEPIRRTSPSATSKPTVRSSPTRINSFVGAGGVAMFFPLGRPTTWRVIAMAADAQTELRRSASGEIVSDLELSQLQALVDPPTAGAVRLRDPAWLTHFHLHHRQTESYRSGNVFLAGDAAHIHSPVGAQGMNTGIQDAWNLGWKLGLVARGLAEDRLLDTYEAERWPVGQFLLRYTDRLFSTFTRAMSGRPLATWARRVCRAAGRPPCAGVAMDSSGGLCVRVRARHPLSQESNRRRRRTQAAGAGLGPATVFPTPRFS